MKSPIYTEKAECRDCYKCVRQCPVKAIRVNNGSAVVMHELCIFCGKCIEVCPVNAKKLRSDIARAKQLIELNETVIASIAPSFPAEFDVSEAGIIHTLKKLGFSGVSETSIGAEIVSRRISEKLAEGSRRIISSACPTVRELVSKYRPELVPYLSELVSPLHAHAELLKKLYGENIKVVFIGPCISKKLEADDESTPIDLALTFAELRDWMKKEDIELVEPEGNEISGAVFIPENVANASEFAVEGGMLNTIKKDVTTVDSAFFSFSGIGNVVSTFRDLEQTAEKGIFLEYLACDGGCVSGRGMTTTRSYLLKRLKVLEYYRKCMEGKKQKHPNKQDQGPAVLGPEIETGRFPEPVVIGSYSEEGLAAVLRTLEKYSKEDEINCGGCGYNSCRDFAVAMIEGKAEASMCVTHMRKLAEKKSNALMKALPLSVVITDQNRRILECNEKFLHTFSDIDLELSDRIENRIEGLPLERFVPETDLFTKIQNSEVSMLEGKIRNRDRVFRVFVFRIGQEHMIGAIYQDITSPAVKREMIIKKTEEVIEKNLSSVQQIASLLGENAAETQLILNSLIESFTVGGEEQNERFS